jgi:hypothetical protein
LGIGFAPQRMSSTLFYFIQLMSDRWFQKSKIVLIFVYKLCNEPKWVPFIRWAICGAGSTNLASLAISAYLIKFCDEINEVFSNGPKLSKSTRARQSTAANPV